MSTGRDLLAQIEAGALDSKVDIADLLRRCVALGGASGSTKLRDWASRELKGYDGSDELPSYRVITAPLFIDGITPRMHFTGQQFSPMSIPEFARETFDGNLRMMQGIGEIAAMVRNAEKKSDGGIRLQLSGMPDLVAYMNTHHVEWGCSITAMYYKASPSTLEGIVDAVRTVLVELVAEVRAGLPRTAEGPGPELMDQAVGVAVYGDHNRVQITSASHGPAASSSIEAGAGAEVRSTMEGSPSEQRHWAWWLVAGATVIGSLAGVWALFLR